jgi:methionyl-tRNA formyltransferase
MRVVFMGSSAASATCLRAIMRESELEVVGVVTQPDRPAGRGKALTPCPCKAFAIERGLTEIATPEDVNSEEALSTIRSWRPDVVAVVAFGQFLKKPLLELPIFGCVNCHFSLLPKYRGASPVVAALAAGERMTGVSVIRMGIGMDDGPILLQSYEPIYSDVTGGELMDGLAVTGGVTLAKALKLMNRNALPPPVMQNDAEATFARKLRKSDGLVDWSEPALAIERKIRAYSPWPGCHSFLPARFRRKGNSGRVSILRSEIVGRMDPSWRGAPPGTVLECVTAKARDGRWNGTGPIVKCGDTAIMITELKPEGGSAMDGASFLRGRPLVPGDDSLLRE